MVRGKFVEPLPGSAPRKILEQLKPLFEIPDRTGDLLDLPILRSQGVFSGWSWLELPDWARRCVPRDRPGLFLPRFSDTNSYLEYDWWRAIDFFLSCEFERSIEARSGPTHSYAGSMGEKVAPAFDYAWVNRIVAFLKIWWARLHGLSVENHFGEVPAGVITLTHDVDALEKTARLRLKQSAFQLLSGNIGGAIRMLFGTEDYSRHAEIIAAEQAYGWTSVWCIYAGTKRNSLTLPSRLLDPAYSLVHEKLFNLLESVRGSGGAIGLHSSFSSWNQVGLMTAEQEKLRDHVGQEIKYVRQHWLRFSFKETWKIQQNAGLEVDFTLGFNDRTGFRGSAALPITAGSAGLTAIPTVIMDSNLYDSKSGTEEDKFREIDRILDEVEEFGGHVAVNWHPHTFAPDFGWGSTYTYLLQSISVRRIKVKI